MKKKVIAVAALFMMLLGGKAAYGQKVAVSTDLLGYLDTIRGHSIRGDPGSSSRTGSSATVRAEGTGCGIHIQAGGSPGSYSIRNITEAALRMPLQKKGTGMAWE